MKYYKKVVNKDTVLYGCGKCVPSGYTEIAESTYKKHIKITTNTLTPQADDDEF